MRNVLLSKSQRAERYHVYLNTAKRVNPLHGMQPYHGKGTCIIQWSYEPCCAGDPKWLGHSEEFWQNMVHSRRKLQSTPVFLPGEPQRQYEKAKGMTLEDEPHRLEGIQYATGEEQKAITNSSKKNEVAGPQWEWHTAVDVSGAVSKVQWCKEQHCTGT